MAFSTFMSGHVSVLQDLYAAVHDGKPLLKRCFCFLLNVILHPILFSVAALCGLYSLAYYRFTTHYFPVLSWSWMPAFPLSWRLVFLSLFVVPAFACLHLLRLSVQRLLLARQWWRPGSGAIFFLSPDYILLQRSDSNLSESRELLSSMSRSEEGCDAELEVEDIGSPESARVQDRASPRQSLLVWSLHFIFWLSILCISLWYGLHYQHPGDVRYLPLVEKANANPNRVGYSKRDEKIFIAAMFTNNEGIIPYWSDSIVKAIHYLGADNVFVSILESGSSDKTPALLEKLDERLSAMNVARRILVRDEEIPKPGNLDGNRRIDFLSALRNRVLAPLVENGGYDKVLFSNDIFIEAESIIELLETANGEYDMVCGLDFGSCGTYDTWVIRDKIGRLTSGIWPYFTEFDDYEAMKTESPVPVFTCWNGIVAFKADPILPIHLRSNRTLSNYPLPYELPLTHPAARDPSLRGPSPALTPPLRFRSIVSGECFSSECFLFPYDLRRLFNMQRIYANPRVIVAYTWEFYSYFKWWMRHPVMKWWIETIYDGAWMQWVVHVLGDDGSDIWNWDGGECHPRWRKDIFRKA